MNYSDIKDTIQITHPENDVWVVKVVGRIKYFREFLKYCKKNKAKYSKEMDGLVFNYDPTDILSKYEYVYKSKPRKKKIGRPKKRNNNKVNPKVKELWQMTMKEYTDSLELFTKEGKKKYVQSRELQLEGILKHESAVEKALSEGKLVPENVLADYPDLIKKQELEIKFSSGGDAIGEEYHGWIKAIDKNTDKVLGIIDYSYWEEETSIKMIEVNPEYRRKGIGIKLLDKLQSESEKPLTVQGNLATDAGQALWNKWKGQEKTESKKTTDMEIEITKPQKLEDIENIWKEAQRKRETLNDKINAKGAELKQHKSRKAPSATKRWIEYSNRTRKLEGELDELLKEKENLQVTVSELLPKGTNGLDIEGEGFITLKELQKRFMNKYYKEGKFQEEPIEKPLKYNFMGKIRIIKPFVSTSQLESLVNMYRGEEKQAAIEIVNRLHDIITKMPETYQTEKISAEHKILHLHYFSSSSDWYIVEKDGGSEDDKIKGLQIQSFGYAILNHDERNAEWGYISIEELRKSNVELDFYWNPITLKDLKEKKAVKKHKENSRASVKKIKTVKAVKETVARDKKVKIAKAKAAARSRRLRLLEAMKPKKVRVVKGAVYKLDDKYYKAKTVRKSGVNSFWLCDKEGNIISDDLTGGVRLISKRTNELILIKKS